MQDGMSHQYAPLHAHSQRLVAAASFVDDEKELSVTLSNAQQHHQQREHSRGGGALAPALQG